MSQPENLDSPTLLLQRLHRWRMAFFGLIILIAGLTTGAASTLLVLHWKGTEQPATQNRAHEIMMERVVPYLGLSAEQTARVDPILRRHTQRLEEIREEGRQQIIQELDTMDKEMSATLNPDQQQRWRDLLQGLPGRAPGPGRDGAGPRGPFGPRGGGGGGGFRRGVGRPSASPEPNASSRN